MGLLSSLERSEVDKAIMIKEEPRSEDPNSRWSEICIEP